MENASRRRFRMQIVQRPLPVVARSSACAVLFFAALACGKTPADYKGIVKAQLEFNRQSTNKMLDEMEKTGRADEILAWRAAPGRAPIGWQIMHLASTEDRMAKAIGGTALASEKFADQFKSGKPPSDWIPKMAETRKYLADSRAALEKAIDTFDLKKMEEKPADFPFNYQRMFQILMWHEGHHQGQAHATYNLFKAAHKIADAKPDM